MNRYVVRFRVLRMLFCEDDYGFIGFEFLNLYESVEFDFFVIL